MHNSFVMSSAVVNGNCPPRGLGGQFHPSFGDCFALRPTSTTHMSPIQKFKNKCPPRGLGGQFGPLWGASGEALERLWRGSGKAPERACATLCAHSVHTLRRGRLWRPFWAPFLTPKWFQNVKHSSKSGVREESARREPRDDPVRPLPPGPPLSNL